MNNASPAGVRRPVATAVTQGFPSASSGKCLSERPEHDDSAVIDNPLATVPCETQGSAAVSGSSEHLPSLAASGAPDTVLDALPRLMRIQSLDRLLEGDKILNRATLYHRRASLCVDWITQQIDTRLHRSGLVSIRRAAATRCNDGATRIQRLLPETRVQPSFNLFETLLPTWLKDPDLAQRAALLWESLPRRLGHLLNAVLWESERLHRFVTGPSSIRGHHNEIAGNFRHSIDVAERARDLGRASQGVNVPLLIAGGLLHDVAKAAEYRFDRANHRFRLSDRGELVGHRDTLIEWLAVARETGGVIIDEASWLALLHMLNATRGAPSWIGLRAPRSVEAEILSIVDRLSGHEDLQRRGAAQDEVIQASGFGSYHPYPGHRSKVTRELGT